MDFSSEMIHALLPIYLVGAMGATMAEIGVIEGVAEATASIVKIFWGFSPTGSGGGNCWR